MLIGVFADSHDHLDNIRHAVNEFNRAGCELVVFAGDMVSTFSLPPLRRLRCPLIGCFGDNDGNKPGLLAGMSIIGTLGEPPLGLQTADGTRIVVAHMWRQFRGAGGEFDIAIFGHTHKPEVTRDEQGRLYVNPGETSGWTYRRPTIALVDTMTRSACVVPLPEMPTMPRVE